jgi:hypothetical protein
MFALGVWLAGTILVSVVAAQNFFTIDRLLAESPNATFMSLVERIGRSEARDLLRYLSSELNRLYFQMWNVTQCHWHARLLVAGRKPIRGQSSLGCSRDARTRRLHDRVADASDHLPGPRPRFRAARSGASLTTPVRNVSRPLPHARSAEAGDWGCCCVLDYAISTGALMT